MYCYMCFDFFEKERFDASEFIVLIQLPTLSIETIHNLASKFEPQALKLSTE